jgi:soluble lytic murein transglycosylase-like protein
MPDSWRWLWIAGLAGVWFLLSRRVRGEEPPPSDSSLDRLVAHWASIYGVDERLVRAIIAVESGGHAVCTWEVNVRDWSCGVMQVRVETARGMGFTGGKEELREHQNSVRYGTQYLGYQLHRYRGDVARAVSAYNAGTATPANAQYVQRVLTEWRRIQ